MSRLLYYIVSINRHSQRFFITENLEIGHIPFSEQILFTMKVLKSTRVHLKFDQNFLMIKNFKARLLFFEESTIKTDQILIRFRKSLWYYKFVSLKI